MQKGNLETNDGGKLEVFWLKSQTKPEEDIQSSCVEGYFEGVHGCCPVGPVGEKGEKGVKDEGVEEIHPLQEKFQAENMGPTLQGEILDDLLEEEGYDITKDPIDKLFKMTFGKIMKKEKPLPVQIADTIDCDVVKEPVIGEIYRIKGLNIAAKYMGKHREKDLGQVFYQMRYHTYPFFVLDVDDMLLKTTEFERELYLNFKL